MGWLFPSPAAGQEEQSTVTWTVTTLGLSYCVEFLMDSAAAEKQIRKSSRSYRAIPASRFGQLHPAIRSLIERRPEFADWVPAQLCFIGADTVAVGSRVSTAEGSDKRQMVGFWTIAAATGDGPVNDSLFMARFVFTNNHRIDRNSGLQGLEVETVTEAVGNVPESTDTRHEVKVKKAELRWDGHLAGESHAPAEPRSWIFAIKAKSNEIWRVRVRVWPTDEQPVVGSLRVNGKDDLAKALRGSPIRMLGPAFWGGGASFEFSRNGGQDGG